MKRWMCCVLGAFVTIFSFTPSQLPAQITAFTYQGRLDTNGQPANGLYDFQFRLYDAPTNGGQIPVIPVSPGVPVSNGLFTTGMDFGSNVFNGTVYYLEIAVQPKNGGGFVTLSPRQAILPVPGAVFATSASNLLGTLPAAQLSGTIASGTLPASPNFSGTVTGNSFSGNGAGISNVNALTLSGIGASGLWQTAGNSGTTGGLNFLGTTDNQPLDLRANGWRGLRLAPAVDISGNRSNMVNVIGGVSLNFVAPGAFGATIGGGGAGSYFGPPYSNSVSADFGTIAGGQRNFVNGYAGFVGSGLDNVSGDSYSMVGGGDANTSGGIGSTVGGGLADIIQTNAFAATIGGGFFNLIQTNAQMSAILGGMSNTILPSASNSVIVGGLQNIIGGNKGYGTIGGGAFNVVSNLAATVAGGAQNISIGQESTVGGGGNNIATAEGATVSGGYFNTNTGIYAALAGGSQNLASGKNAMVPGGVGNVAKGQTSFAAGTLASANHKGAFVWADSQGAVFASTTNDQFLVRAQGGAGFVTSGAGLTVDGQPVLTTGNSVNGISIQQNSSGGPNVIEGSQINFAAGGVVGATISGGGATNYSGFSYTNSVTADFGTVGGGGENHANGFYATVGGGEFNSATGYGAVVAGGGVDGSIFSPYSNIASGPGSAILGGVGNSAAGYESTVGGGVANQATNYGATVPGGAYNVAGGQYSFAAGQAAEALHQGSFVWADSQFPVFASTANNQFLIRALGGVGIGTPNPQGSLHVYSDNNPTVVRIQSTGTPGFGRIEFVSNPQGDANEWRPAFIQSLDGGSFTGGLGFYLNGSGSGVKFATNEVMRLINGNVGIGTINPVNKLQVVTAYCTGTMWVNSSDRNLKENFAEVDALDVLEKIALMPIGSWSYKSQPGEKHIGPMAQDFHAAFALGDSDRSISTVDEGGVALVAIQGLNQKVEAGSRKSEDRSRVLEERLAQKETEITELKRRLEALEKIILSPKSD